MADQGGVTSSVPGRPLPALWTSALYDPSGYADEARSFLLALERAGERIAAREERWTKAEAGLTRAHRDVVERALARRPPGGTCCAVYHGVPGATPGGARGPVVWRTMFETDSLPPLFRAPLVAADEVWVPTEWNVETFQRGGVTGSRLHVLPGTIDLELFDPARVQRAPREDGRFAFVSNFDFTDRKGWDVLLDAWALAFAPDDGVVLRLKTLATYLGEDELRGRIDAYLNGRETAPIELDVRIIDVADMPSLYADADAYVLATRGEGWGRPFMEAMAMGLPTIGSRWSAHLAFMHDGNSWLVDGDVVPVAEDSQSHAAVLYRGQRWFQPDVEALASAMREVAAGGSAVERRAAAARPELLERFGPAPIAARIRELVLGANERWEERQRRPVSCVWRGEWGGGQSLAVVNDGICDALERAGGRVVRCTPGTQQSTLPAVGVAEQWPPSFDAPSAGPFVLYQPWEYSAIPVAWLDDIRWRVDEIWVHAESVRRGYVDSGIAPELVHVVPGGVDLDRFRPDGPRASLPTDRSTVLLFVGGTIWRKGIDLLVEAYARAFSKDDDVCLAIKSFGASHQYRGTNADDRLRAILGETRWELPEIVLLDEHVGVGDMPALYRAASALVQPYRGEGYCLPALEALACGVPVLVTAGGPTDDFVTDECAWRVPSTVVPVKESDLPAGYDLAGQGTMVECDLDALVAALREAADPAARAAKAAAARPQAERHGWDVAAAAAATRIAALAGRTPIRLVPPADVPARRRLMLVADADWDRPETWAPAVRAYAAAFGPEDDATLVLPAPDEQRAVALVLAELAAAGVDAGRTPDIALADPGPTEHRALELAADAVIATAGRSPERARRVVAAEAAALRDLYEQAS